MGEKRVTLELTDAEAEKLQWFAMRYGGLTRSFANVAKKPPRAFPMFTLCQKLSHALPDSPPEGEKAERPCARCGHPKDDHADTDQKFCLVRHPDTGSRCKCERWLPPEGQG